MTDDEPNTFLLDHDPANLLPYSKRLAPEDPEAVNLGFSVHQSRMFDDDYGPRYTNG
jgi:hypothetical protein